MSDPYETTPYRGPVDAAAPRFSAGEVLAGRYRIVAPLGKGGMGEVYRADDLTLGQPVALKFLPTHLSNDPDRLARFRKEVASARRVSHPNVCRVYDIVEHDGQSFLAMEFVDGEDLASVLRRMGRVPEEKGIEVARQLCSALAAVHDQGLLHRDLKPANVMLDGRGKVRLTDFGLAAAAQDLTATEVRSGTPLYQAPEQLAGREVTERSDLYSLGLVLYELFTGKRPFIDSSRDTPPSKPSTHVSGLSPTVEHVILKCLEPDPVSRPRSAVAVLAQLPGGDPLAAAMAAGETPSPRLVADAPVEGTLRPVVAWAMVGGIVVLLLLIAWLNDRVKAHRHVPFPPPAVLEERATRMVRDLGYTELPADTAGGFEMPFEHRRYMDTHNGQPVVPVDQMGSCRPGILLYWHRQSPRPLLPVNVVGPGELNSWNPPHNIPGMITLCIDTRARLVQFQAVPDSEATGQVASINWDAVLKLAELDAPGVLRADPTAKPTPPVFADETRVWFGTYPEQPEMAIRVEAAAYRGRLVFFRISHPDWGDPSLDRPAPTPASQREPLLAAIATVVWFLMIAWCVVAVRNVQRGRADVRGGLRVAALAGGLMLIHELLVNAHFSNWQVVLWIVLSHLAWIVLVACVLFGGYQALEPLVRRRCPHRLISWTRLMDGRWRDPVVGRHVLIGILAGLACSLDWPTVPFWPASRDWGPSVAIPAPFTRPLGSMAGHVAAALMLTWLYIGVFAVLLTICRREWLAVTLVALVVIAPFLFESRFSIQVQVFSLLKTAVLIGLFLRLGVLPALTANVGINIVMLAPLTLDGSAWYLGVSLTYFAVVIALTGFAAYTATEGRLFGKGGDGERPPS